METKMPFIEPLFERAKEYGKVNYELVKLKTIKQTASIVSTYVPKIIVTLILAMFALVLTLGAAFWLGELLGKIYYGFFAVAGFYLFIGGVLYLFSRSIKNRINDSIISQLLN